MRELITSATSSRVTPLRPIRLKPSQAHSALGCDSFDNKAVRRKVADVNDDLVSPRLARQRGPNPLIEHDAGRIPDHSLTRRRAQHHATEPVTDA